jgi:hypothetical protein
MATTRQRKDRSGPAPIRHPDPGLPEQRPTPMTDRRAFPRHRVHINGKIILMDGPCYVDCVIRNISEDGAHVTMQVPMQLPVSVYLWEAQTRMIFECSVQWRRQTMVGLRFTDRRGRAMRRTLFEVPALQYAGLAAGSTAPRAPAMRPAA